MLETQKVSADGGVMVLRDGSDRAGQAATAAILTIGGLIVGGAVVGLIKNQELTTKSSELALSNQNTVTNTLLLYGRRPYPVDVNINQGNGIIQ